MKDLFKDSDLWRQKRGELPVDSEPQSGWQEMQSILDKHLPVLPLAPVAHVSKFAKVLKAIKAIKATSLLIASLTVATVAGSAIYLVKTARLEKTQHSQHDKSPKHVMEKDGLTDSLAAKSPILKDSLNIVSDSVKNLNNQKNEPSPSLNQNDSVNVSQASNSGNVKINGQSPGSTANNQQAVSTQQKGSSNIVKGPSAGNARYNAGNSLLPGKYQNSKQFVRTGAQNTQQSLVNDSNATTKSGHSDDQSIQNSDPDNSTIMPSSNNNIKPWQLAGINNNTFIHPQAFANQPISKFVIGDYYYRRLQTLANNKSLNKKNKAAKNASVNNSKTKKPKTSSGRSLSEVLANVDWGVSLGANTSGSFTSSSQNKNIYGSFPIDIYPGLFSTYHLNDKWAINAQVRLLTPLNLSGSYDNKNYSNVDSAQFVKVTDSRKAYFVNIPIHVMYKINNNISVKGGPVINLPVKQINSNTNLQHLDINVDTIYFANTLNKIKTTRYDQKINFGLSGGVSVQFNRLIFEALYQKSIGGYEVKSDFGNYKTSPGSLQISVGFKLNGSKHH